MCARAQRLRSGASPTIENQKSKIKNSPGNPQGSLCPTPVRARNLSRPAPPSSIILPQRVPAISFAFFHIEAFQPISKVFKAIQRISKQKIQSTLSIRAYLRIQGAREPHLSKSDYV
jgi:hypothetical protein